MNRLSISAAGRSSSKAPGAVTWNRRKKRVGELKDQIIRKQ